MLIEKHVLLPVYVHELRPRQLAATQSLVVRKHRGSLMDRSHEAGARTAKLQRAFVVASMLWNHMVKELGATCVWESIPIRNICLCRCNAWNARNFCTKVLEAIHNDTEISPNSTDHTLLEVLQQHSVLLLRVVTTLSRMAINGSKSSLLTLLSN